MPLQGRKPFQRLKPPKDLRLHEELFYCKITHEIFREYEEFFDRVILCNSLVWTCSLTGKPGLTFQEALESEKNARLTLQRFPEPLKKPLLFLATLTERGRLNDMCDDVFAFVRDRYFVHEEVEVTLNGIKKLCEVIKVISPEKEIKSPGKQENNKINKKVKNVSPDKLKYEVREKELGKTAVVKSQCISRPKGKFTKATNKLFLKHHTSSVDGVWKVKNEAVTKYNLKNFEFKEVFTGPLPKYAASPTKKKVSASPEKEKKKKVSTTSEESTGGKKAVQGKINFKKESEGQRLKNLEKEQEEFEKQRMILEEQRQKRKEELKKRIEEDRERQRAQKLKEREEKKEEKRKLAEYLSSWKKPRDDLECDDLKDLPKPVPIDCDIPESCFGDAIMILEFLSTFSEPIKLKDSFPHGFTFEHLVKALLETDIQGCFNDLVQLLLTSLFQLGDYDNNEKLNERKFFKNPVIDLKNNLTLEEAEKIANTASAWPRVYHGTVLQKMPLDSFSITEILRLHILASGSNSNFSQGTNGTSEDPGLYFKVEEYQLLQKLATTSIFQLNCEERVKILTLLVHQLACCESLRNQMEENLPKARTLYYELKMLRCTYSRQEKEEEALNSKKKAEKDGKNPEAKLTDGETEITEEPVELSPEEKQALEEKHRKDTARRRSDFLRKEREIKAQIQLLKSSYQAVPLGRDRAFRRFWVFNSLPGLFVEDDDKYVGPCLLKETPQVPANAAINRTDVPVGSIRKYLQHLGDNKNGSSDKENDILQDLAIIQSDFPVPMKGRKLSDLNTRVDLKKNVLDSNSHESLGCLQCKEKIAEFQGSMPWYCPHLKTSSIYGLCTASIDTCPVHNLNAPRTKWSFFYKPDDLDALVNALNPRGFREGALRKAIMREREMLLEMMNKCQYTALNKTLPPPPPQPEVRKSLRGQAPRKSEFANMKPEVALELTLRDMILELEHRIFAGGLGSLKVANREAWRDAIEKLTDLESDNSNADTKVKEETEPMSTVIKDLALALLQISDGIEGKFLLRPLSDSDAFKQLREKAKIATSSEVRQKTKESEGEIAQSPVLPKIPKSCLEKWQESLTQCSSLAQLFVHLGTLERSVAWSRSVLKAHCRICRRRGDAENMLLCDECNRGHHLYCLKPPLEKIPEGDWFCLSCRPPEKVVTPRKKNINYCEIGEDGGLVKDSDDSDAEEEEEEDEEEEEEGSEYSNDEDDDEDAEDSDANEFVDEVCESCGGTGTVICCDKCPKVYHPECIGLRRIPRGEWLCPSCTKKEEAFKKTQKHSPSGNYSTRAQTLLDKTKSSSKSTSLRPRIQIKASKRKRSDSSDSESYPSKKSRSDNKKDDEKENPFKKVYKDSALNMSRRRSKSSGDSNMLDYKTCLDLLVELMHHPSGWPFLGPVSKKDAPDYHLIIKRPMDFGTIRSNLNNMTYKNNDDFVRDLYLVLQNCELFNPRYSPEYKAARALQKEAERLIKEFHLSQTIK